MAIPFENTLGVLHRDSQRLGWWLTLLGVSVMLVWLFIAFTVSLPVTVTSVDGRVVSAIDPLEVNSKSEEPIVALPSKLGEGVNRGDVLVEFDSLPMRLELEISHQRVATLEQELNSIEKEMSSITESLVSELESYDRAFERLEAGIGETRVQITHSTQAEKLYRELRSERRIDALEYSRVSSELAQNKLRFQAQEAETKELLANRRLVVSRSKTMQSQLTRQRARLEGDIAELLPEQRRLRLRVAELTVRAPFSGEIGAISSASIGQTVQPGGWLMTLVPTREYEFQATFSAREAAGRISSKQSARIQFHALPWTEYGTLGASVLRVGSEERAGTVRVDFRFEADPRLATLLSHGLKGQVVVQIDEATLVQRMIRLLTATGSNIGDRPDLQDTQ